MRSKNRHRCRPRGTHHRDWADALLAVQALGEDARNGGLAHAPRAGEQERVVHPARLERVHQGAQHVLLPDQLGELLGPPLARQCQVTHGPWILTSAPVAVRLNEAPSSARPAPYSVGVASTPVSPCAQRMKRRRPAPAMLRHPTSPLPLLPSGPGGVYGWSSRRDRCGSPEPRRGPGCADGVAERVGFEPTNTREDVTGIPVQRLRPLGHLSAPSRGGG